MLHLCYSNRTEALLDALVERLAAERGRKPPLAPARLVVPNRNVQTYVTLGLAQATGIAANLEITFLRRFLARVAERALPDTRVIDAEQLEGLLVGLLHDDERLAADPALAPVLAYLRGGDEVRDGDLVDRRRAQLAAELARLYDEYAASRPRMLAEWKRAPTLPPGSPLAATEAWQRALWLALFGPNGAVAARSAREGIAWLPLGELLAAAEARLDPTALGPALHVFGVSYVAEAYHRMLAALARAVDVHVYTLNPCREFWEDLETAAERGRRTRRARGGRKAAWPSRAEARQGALPLGDDPFGLAGGDAAGENLALRLWGRPGRENVRLLNALTDADFDGRFVANADRGGRSLLARLQDDVLDRVGAAEPASADGSVVVLACPGLRRELEVVAAEIWRAVRADPTLRLNEVAVVVPEARKDEYLAQLPAVFAESHGLPHNVADLPIASTSRLTEAAQLLLGLPLGELGRRELLPLLTHPSILARFPEASASQVIRLVDELGIVAGASREEQADTYLDRDLFNWDQGLRRLALGALMSGPRDGDDEPVRDGDDAYLPADRPDDEREAALGVALLARSLLADVAHARRGRRPLVEWTAFMRALLTSYLVPADDGEAAQLARALVELDGLDDLDLGGHEVSYRVAHELASRRVGRAGGERGAYLARGVTVASFVPMRAIPFRQVFVVGLGHGDFPASARRSPLDLREARRMPGDVSPREQDLYMFLETLLCARERLVLSYVARDELTGERLEPSALLLELRELLAAGYLDDAALARVFTADPPVPLRRYDDGSRLELHPAAAREARARALGADLRAASEGASPRELVELRRALPEETLRTLAEPLALPPPVPRARVEDSRATVAVTLATLRQFLEDPLQGSARFRLRLRDVEGDDELADRDAEPFELRRHERAETLREALIAELTAEGDGPPRRDDVIARWNDVRERRLLDGRAPAGLFSRAERPLDEEMLAAWWRQLGDASGTGTPPRGRVYRFGRAAAREPAREIHPAIVLDPDEAHGRRIELAGRTELVVAPAPGARASVVLFARTPKSRRPPARELLRAFLDHVALAAAGFDGEAHGAWLVNAEGKPGAAERPAFAPVDRGRARRYLAELTAELLAGSAADATGAPTGVHAYLLPCEAVFAAREREAGDVVDVVEELRDGYLDFPRANGFSSAWGPVPQAVERHHPPSLDAAARMVEARFGLLFELLESGAAAPTGARRRA